MKERTKEIILKLVLIIGLLITILAIYFGIKAKTFNNEAEANKYDLIGKCLLGPLFIDAFLILALSSIPSFKAKPKKYLLKQKNYQEFTKYLENRVKEFNYELVSKQDNIKFYKRTIKKKIYYIIDTKIEELTDENFKELYNNQIFPVIEADFNQMQYKWYSLYVTFIISVDRITPEFNKFIASTDIDKRFHKYPVGISFGGNKMYINDDIYGFNKNQSIHKEFMQIIKLEEALDETV